MFLATSNFYILLEKSEPNKQISKEKIPDVLFKWYAIQGNPIYTCDTITHRETTLSSNSTVWHDAMNLQTRFTWNKKAEKQKFRITMIESGTNSIAHNLESIAQ